MNYKENEILVEELKKNYALNREILKTMKEDYNKIIRSEKNGYIKIVYNLQGIRYLISNFDEMLENFVENGLLDSNDLYEIKKEKKYKNKLL